MSKSIEEMKAEFLAKGGAVVQVAVGATNGMRHADWKAATRGESLPARHVLSMEQQAEQFMEHVRDAAMVGGTSAAIRTMNDLSGATRRKSKGSGKRNYAAQEAYNREWGVDY